MTHVVVVQQWSDGQLHFSHVIGPFPDFKSAKLKAQEIQEGEDYDGTAGWVEADVEVMEAPL